MFGPKKQSKGVVLFIVLGTLLLVMTLAGIVLNFILSNYRLTFHQTNRIRAYYAAMAGTNYANEMLRKGTWAPNASGGSSKFACLNGCITATADYTIPADLDVPYSVEVRIYPIGSGINGTTKISSKVRFTLAN